MPSHFPGVCASALPGPQWTSSSLTAVALGPYEGRQWWEGFRSVCGSASSWGLKDTSGAVLLTNMWSGPGGQEGPLPGPLPSIGAVAGRGASAIQIAISCCRLWAVFFRTVAETGEAGAGWRRDQGGIQPASLRHSHVCMHTHSCAHTQTHSHILRYKVTHTHQPCTHTLTITETASPASSDQPGLCCGALHPLPPTSQPAQPPLTSTQPCPGGPQLC